MRTRGAMSEESQPAAEGGDRHLLVPLSDTLTVRHAVDHAVGEAGDGSVHLVVARSSAYDAVSAPEEGVESLLNRAQAWAEEDAGESSLTIETAVIGEDEFLFGPGDYARIFAAYVEEHGLDAIVLDPEYWADTTTPLVRTFRAELAAREIPVETAETPRPARHERVTSRWNPSKVVAVFAISFGFYLLLGDPSYWFDVLTGIAVAGIVSLSLSHVIYGRSPRFPHSIIRTLRFGLFLPYLAWEIVKANVAIALVILRPSMPIDPRMTRIRARVDTGLPTLALANSITLTPGTLTVRASSDRLIVHTLVPAARDDLFEGRLERAVRFLFYGREAAAIPTPKEREEAEILDGGEEW